MAESKLPNLIDKHVGRRVRGRRRELKLSQDKLATILGLTFQQVQKYEKGTNRISSGRLFNIARALDTSINYFFKDAPEFDGVAPNIVAEPSTNNRLDDLIDPDSIDLITAFQAIPDERLRKSILRMINDISGWMKVEKLPSGDSED